MLLKSSFVKAKKYASKSYSLIVTSCFITLSKTAFAFIVSFITSRYCFLEIFCLLQTAFKLSFTFTKTASFIRLFNFMSLFIMFITIASFYSLAYIIFEIASLCFISLVLFRIFVKFLYLLSFKQVCFI